MKKRMFEMYCPHCHHKFYIQRDIFLRYNQKSREYHRLKDQTLFHHQCQNCKQMFYMTYPLLYWDNQKDFCVVLSHKEDLDNLPGTKTILCRDPHQFLFAFQVLDLGLNLKEMISIKKAVEQKIQNTCFLLDYSAKEKALLFRSGQQEFWVAFDKGV